MERSRGYLRMKAGILLLYLTLAAFSLTHCDAERSMRLLKGPTHGRILNHKKHPKKLRMIFKHFDLNPSLDSSKLQPYSVSSPNSLPPYESLTPMPLPQNNPPFCPFPPNPPSTTSIPTPTGNQLTPPSPSYYPSPVLPTQNPPPSPPGSLPTPTPQSVPSPAGNIPGSSPEPIQNPPIIFPGPPGSTTSPPSPPGSLPTPTPQSVPNPAGNIPGSSPEPIQNPPIIFPAPPGSTTSPPYFEPSPPVSIPSPSGGTVPSPIVYEPPVVYPPPSAPPPPNTGPNMALWCVAKPSVPDPILQEAMNYACGSGADCDPIQPNGPCFEPNTLYAHASYAFNSFWQMTRVAGGTCEFGGTAILVSVDPSYDGCHFVYNA